MGWADLLFLLGIPYDSEAALDLADRLMAFVKDKAHDQSARLADERGPFPSFGRSIHRHGRPLRNSAVTTIAPTGTISMIAGCSSGIEPVFALAFEHRARGSDGERVLTFVSDAFERMARARGFYSEPLMAEVVRRGSIQHVPGVDEAVEGGLQDRARHRSHLARATPGRVPAPHRQRRLQDGQPPPRRDRGGRGGGVPGGVGPRLPRHHRVPRRLQGRAGAERRDRAGARAPARAASSRAPTA